IPPVSHADALKYIAEGVDLQHSVMSYPRIGGVTFVMMIDGLTRMSEKDGVAVGRLWLKTFHSVVPLGNAIGKPRLVSTIVGVNLLSENTSLERSDRLALLVVCQYIRKPGTVGLNHICLQNCVGQ